ncbi:MAG: hypothetical protein PHW69_09065 [Elusimicrobiaceae bacterium]|nr:hypothetical protein [Elusimicrobiaceae bacterium]
MPDSSKTRFAAYAAILTVMATPLGWLLSRALLRLGWLPEQLVKPVTGAVFFAAGSAILLWFLRRLKPLKTWGLHRAGGSGLPILLGMTFAMSLLVAADGDFHLSLRVAPYLAVALCAAVFDEVVFRAALFNGLKDDLPAGIAAVMVSLMYTSFRGHGQAFFELPALFAYSYLFCAALASGTGLAVLVPAGFLIRVTGLLYQQGKPLPVQDRIAAYVTLSAFALCLGYYLLHKTAGQKKLRSAVTALPEHECAARKECPAPARPAGKAK